MSSQSFAPEKQAALEQRGVGFRSITEAIDATTSSGRLVFHLFGALGQFERDLIRERTRAGLAAAAARGRKGGRKPVVAAEKLACARHMIAKGLSVREVAVRLRIGKTALYEAAQAASRSIHNSPPRLLCSSLAIIATGPYPSGLSSPRRCFEKRVVRLIARC